jgi:hypothetical protein
LFPVSFIRHDERAKVTLHSVRMRKAVLPVNKRYTLRGDKMKKKYP